MRDIKPPQASLMERLSYSWRPLLLLAIMGFVCWRLGDRAAHDYRWQWYRVWGYFGSWSEEGFKAGLLLRGLYLTVKLALGGLGGALAIGVLLAGMRLSPSPVARFLARAFLGAIRNTPLLMQLFVVHFVVAPVLGLGQFAAAVFALAAFEGSYMAEIFRAGIASLPKSQWEAALSLGMGIPMAARVVIFPQVLGRIAAPLVNQIVSLIKDTSLVGAIALADLTMRAREVIAETYLSFEIWLVTAAVYLVLTLLVSIPATLYEHYASRQKENV